MFSLQTLFGSGDKVLKSLTASAEEGMRSASALKQLLNDGPGKHDLAPFADSRAKSKTITQEIREMALKSAPPTIEREEIAALSNILYKIPKSIEKFAERYVLNAVNQVEIKFDSQARILEEAVGIVLAMCQSLQSHSFARVVQQNTRLHQIEGDADKLMLDELRRLYSGRFEPVVAMGLKDLYEILEKAIDQCRDAGNLVAQVVLKNS
jgi:uncharacterized protein Yka (UPF0111/DUF47 family)